MPDYADPRLARPPGTAMPVQMLAAADLLEQPHRQARIGTQVLPGEIVDAFGDENGFRLVQCRRDRYAGWVQVPMPDAGIVPPTHKVIARQTLAFAAPDLKSPVQAELCLGARLTATGTKAGTWIECRRAGWLYDRHIAPIDQVEEDPADVAERFLGMPYFWGGRGARGIDCSGLVQQAFEACGVLLPRDSDMQSAWAGDEVDNWQAPGALKRGDLIFWEGHAGILTRPDELLHANVFHMAVAREPLRAAIARIRPVAGEVITVRRVDLAAARANLPEWFRAAV
ncbi:MAG: NlpC/P60 family protein [Hyphomonas sp.]|jgi:cell wall-associated NlpC family hydrolase